MRIVPVLDLKDGVVVRGIGGRRQQYQPIKSQLTDSTRPVDVARAFRDQLGLSELYVADLNAISGGPPALAVYADLRNLSCRLWVDAGIREPTMAVPLVTAGVHRVVAGLETVDGPSAIESLCRRWGGNRIVFSLDLKGGVPLGDRATWDRRDASSIASQAIRAGVGGLIVLDLARVGMNEGTGTEDLCRQLALAYPDVEIVAGGGVRDRDDLRRLRTCGVGAVLVASALHDGRLTPRDWAKR
jgi:phosphoribosylformimino-5-aminoimidazole carboxamide ribotide isomerase